MISVSFCGLKENIQYGRQAIADVRKEFPDGFKSNTYYDVFIQNKDPEVRHEYTQAIYKTRDLVDWRKRHRLSEKEATELAVKETGAANCGEQAVLVSKRLDEMGIKNKIICMAVCSNKTNYVKDGHTFCVVDTEQEIDAKAPRNWSNEAVIVDMWSDTVARAKDALAFFYTFLKYNPKDDFVRFFKPLDY